VPTSRDFVPWRFLDAGRHSAWKGRHPGVQKPAQQATFGHRYERHHSGFPLWSF
jgi:hypothetical protein